MEIDRATLERLVEQTMNSPTEHSPSQRLFVTEALEGGGCTAPNPLSAKAHADAEQALHAVLMLAADAGMFANAIERWIAAREAGDAAAAD